MILHYSPRKKGAFAFESRIYLESVTIKGELDVIKDKAFYVCTNLKKTALAELEGSAKMHLRVQMWVGMPF